MKTNNWAVVGALLFVAVVVGLTGGTPRAFAAYTSYGCKLGDNLCGCGFLGYPTVSPDNYYIPAGAREAITNQLDQIACPFSPNGPSSMTHEFTYSFVGFSSLDASLCNSGGNSGICTINATAPQTPGDYQVCFVDRTVPPGPPNSYGSNCYGVVILPNSGTVTVTSKNSVTGQGVSGAWTFPSAPAGATVCSASNPCSGSSASYANQPVGDYRIAPGTANDPLGPYALGATEKKFFASNQYGVLDLLGMIPIAQAFSVAPSYTLTLSSGNTISFVINWDPIAALGLSTNNLGLSSASPAGSVTISNTGTPGSTLTWPSAVISYSSGNGWLSVSPSSGSLTNGNASGKSTPLTFTANPAGLSAGTYNATASFAWTSAPGLLLLRPNGTVSITLTIPPGGVCVPGHQQTLGSGACACTENCNGSGTGWSSCSTDSNSCSLGNACVTGMTCSSGACQGGAVVAGTHNACSGQTCSSVANTAASCTSSCANNTDCGACTPVTEKPATTGFSLSASGPSASPLTVTTAQPSFYAFVDYGAVVGSIQAPTAVGATACVFDNAWIGTAARFKCTTPAVGSYTYKTGINGGSECASGPTSMGTVTVNGGTCTPLTTQPCTSVGNVCGMTNSGNQTCNAGGTAWGACTASTPPDSACPSATITTPTSCTAPCNAAISWTSQNFVNVAKIYKNGAFLWNEAQNVPGSDTDWALPVGTYKYCVRATNADWTVTGDLACHTTTVSAAVCTPVTEKPATTGFSLSASGPSASPLTVTTAQPSFYAFVDYGVVVGSIQAPTAVGATACVFDNAWVGTAARFKCTTPAVGSYTYKTGINGGSECASGPTSMGTVTVNGNVCIPGAPRTLGTGACACTENCNGSGTGWSSCSTDSNSCSLGNACVAGMTCASGVCQGGGVVPGTHKACVGQTCASVSNTAAICTSSCANNTDCGACTAIIYKPATSGFSTSTSGPNGNSIKVDPGGTFYTFIDYGVAGILSIQSPASGAHVCVFDNAWIGTAARFKCTAPIATSTAFTYKTGVNGGGSDNDCASGPTTIGTVTTNGGVCAAGTTQPCTSATNVCGMANSGTETCNAGGTAWGACNAGAPVNSACGYACNIATYTCGFATVPTSTTLAACSTSCVAPPTLTASLSANPSSGNAPLTSTLKADVSGGLGGTYNYTFWQDCSYAGTSVSAATTACGAPTKKDNSLAALTDSASVTYSLGTFHPLVIVENGASAVRAVTAAAVTASSGGGGVCAAGTTQPCTSGSNSCGMTNSGTETCNGSGAWGACSASAPPDSLCSPPVSCSSFKATPGAIVPPDKATLSWNCTNVVSGGCSVSGVSGSWNGVASVQVSPTSTTSYILTCDGAGGTPNTVHENISVIVGHPGVIEVNP